jgi:hypothetical protein
MSEKGRQSFTPKRLTIPWELLYEYNPRVADSLKVHGKAPPWVYIEDGEAEAYWGPD